MTSGKSRGPIVLVDDEPALLRSVSAVLRSSGYMNVICIEDSRDLLPLLSETEVGVIMLDLTMPHLSGQALLEHLSADYPDIPVIIMTATQDLATAVDCMQKGAIDYLCKPVDADRIVTTIAKAMEVRSLRTEVIELRDHWMQPDPVNRAAFSNILTRNREMLSIFSYAETISKSDRTILITGETGTGKKLLALSIHNLSGRSGRFIGVHVGSIEDELLSETLFGRDDGQTKASAGLIASAANGTLLIEGVGDLSAESQLKLMRLFQEQTYLPVGSSAPVVCDARIIVSCNQDMQAAVDANLFRRDLYYRLRAYHIEIPPLQNRKDDIALLVEHFVREAANSMSKVVPAIPNDLVSLLNNYAYPGNVRELQSMIYDAVAKNEDAELSIASFNLGTTPTMESPALDSEATSVVQPCELLHQIHADHLPTLKEAESYLIEQALRLTDNHQGVAAQMLGISRQALNKRLTRAREKQA